MSIKMSSLADNTTLLEDNKRTVKKAPIVKQEEALAVKPNKPSALQKIQQRINETPVIDMDKVNAFKQKLANREFTVNAYRLADKLLGFESEIFPALTSKEK